MPYRTGRHNRRNLIYRGDAITPVEDWELFAVLTNVTPTDTATAQKFVDDLNAVEVSSMSDREA